MKRSRIPSFVAASAFAASALAIGLPACSGSDASSPETGDDQNVTAGKACGDDVAIHKKCGAGLKCVFPTTGPISEHTAGVCKAVSQLNGACGNDVAIQKVCADGLTCVFPTTGPISEHTAGTCKPSCPSTAVLCTLLCPNTGKINGVPCTHGTVDAQTCQCLLVGP